MKREENQDGSIVETATLTLTEKRTTYPQNWPAYNAAQTNEKRHFQVLLQQLCEGIEEPEQTNGRPRTPISDVIFAAVFKVYSTMSCRRFTTDLKEAHDEGFIGKCPSYNTVFRVFESEATFKILKSLVEKSAAPLQALESTFAADSSGFTGCRFDRWFDIRYGKTPIKSQKRSWVKAHIMVGVKTNVICAVEIHDQHASDMAQLPDLLATTRRTFQVTDLCADMGYISRANLEVVHEAGATPLIPFRKNATPAAGGLWAKMFYFFQMQREEFLKRYHLRSNVESTFSMIKRKFGDSVRSKTDVAMKNETLAKFVAHNICVLIQEAYESGIDPTFGTTQCE